MSHRARAVLGTVLLLLPLTLHAQGPAPRRAVSIAFRAMVGDRPFTCGTAFPLGTSRAETTASDFRFYVHDVRLLRKDGTSEPVTLAKDSLWQDGEVALLDFESGEASCSNGTKEERHEVTGTVAAGDYTGVSFVVGVPFARNHLDLVTQQAPLTISRMYWSWATGYKFLRIDLRAQRPDTAATIPTQIHLGSTTCTPKGNTPTACAEPNRPTITLHAFDVEKDAVALDLAALLAEVDLLRTGATCMSAPTAPACAPIFAPLGLPFNGAPAKPQTAFRVIGRVGS